MIHFNDLRWTKFNFYKLVSQLCLKMCRELAFSSSLYSKREDANHVFFSSLVFKGKLKTTKLLWPWYYWCVPSAFSVSLDPVRALHHLHRYLTVHTWRNVGPTQNTHKSWQKNPSVYYRTCTQRVQIFSKKRVNRYMFGDTIVKELLLTIGHSLCMRDHCAMVRTLISSCAPFNKTDLKF